MKFKVGDKVRIVNPKQERDFRYKNNIVTIKYINELCSHYLVKENNRPWLDSEVEKNDFTLNDLRFADVLTLRDGNRYVYVDDCIFGEDCNYYADKYQVGGYYNDDLTYEDRDEKDCDIMKVERDGQVIFERDETIKEMTLDEVCKELGYDVKIIKE